MSEHPNHLQDAREPVDNSGPNLISREIYDLLLADLAEYVGIPWNTITRITMANDYLQVTHWAENDHGERIAISQQTTIHIPSRKETRESDRYVDTGWQATPTPEDLPCLCDVGDPPHPDCPRHRTTP